MTRRGLLPLFGIIASIATLIGQESPTIPATPEETASPSPTVSSVRNVRITFVPPPLEGTISLGIYDSGAKLVRVLHQQASLDAFTIGADALITKWDGEDDDGQDLPSGKYHARGYIVGSLQLENVTSDPAASPAPAPTDKVAVKLVPNPLVKNERPTVELSVGFDDTDSFLKTVDELPLYIISKRGDISAVGLIKSGEKAIEVWQDSGAGREHFRLSKLDQMMAFDCGDFDLK
jgi:hypothetical protein